MLHIKYKDVIFNIFYIKNVKVWKVKCKGIYFLISEKLYYLLL